MRGWRYLTRKEEENEKRGAGKKLKNDKKARGCQFSGKK